MKVTLEGSTLQKVASVPHNFYCYCYYLFQASQKKILLVMYLYLVVLVRSKKYRLMNLHAVFAAALVIQGSASVYSKKVEHLHNLVRAALDAIVSKRWGTNADGFKTA